MTYTIRYISGRDLYVAEHAGDVRQALTAAVKAGAYLRGADLGGADLGGADLRGAHLRGAHLRGADLGGAYLLGADLGGAYLRGADLGGAYLRGAHLRGAHLRGAYLLGADLRGADLRGADLRGAYLRGARGVNPYMTTPLHILADQPGRIVAYKLVTAERTGPTYSGLHYRLGETLTVADAETDPAVDCGAGINLATLDWCMTHWRPGRLILTVEFEAADIACIPHGSDGKFRVTRCTVVGEKNLAELGLLDAAEVSA